MSSSSPKLAADIQLRRQIGQRLKEARHTLGYTQQEMASALGIGPARYSKYEIGRSEARYDVLVKFSKLTGVSLDALLAGQPVRQGELDDAPTEPLLACLPRLPIAAVVFDRFNRLVAHNGPYRETFFSRCPHVLRPGAPLPHLIRTWAYSEGHDLAETEDYVRQRVHYDPGQPNPVMYNLGATRLRIAESRHNDYRLILITDVIRPAPST